MNIDQMALEAMREVCAMGEQYPNDQPAQRKARIQITIRAAIEEALAGNKKLLEESLEREKSLVKLLDKMNRQVVGCEFHGHNVESCFQHSGQAPCMSEDEMALEAHIERIKELLEGVIESDLDTAPEWDVEVSQWLRDIPENSLARMILIKKAEALEEIVLAIKTDARNEMHGYAMHLSANIAGKKADALRQQALEIK